MIFNITSGKKWIYDNITVTIKGNTSTSTYDGAAHSASGYTVTVTGSSTYSTSDVSFSGSASASRTAAGTSNMGLAASQFANTNPMYRNVSFVVTDGYVKINQKAVTVTADNKSKTYGDSDPTLTATITGRVSTSDTITYSISRASGNNAGTYAITPTGTASQGNYTVTFQTGTFTINRKAVTVKADNKSKTYGASDPTLTATVTGLVGSDTVSYTLSRASGSNVGTYTITPTGNATQGNYTVTFTTGTFTINKAAASALGLSVSGGTYTYNGTARSITATTSVTSGTTIYYSSNGSSGWTTTKPTLTNAGSITTYVKAVNSNYNDATGNATVTINKAAASGLGLSVTAYSALYNGSAHTVTASVSVTSGTTIQYSTDNSTWSTTNSSRTNVGVTTVYVRAVNSNYNTATATSSVTIKCRVTVTTAASASGKFGSTTVTANSSGVATYDATASGNLSITSTKNSLSATGTVSVPTNNAAASLALPIRTWLFKSGEGAQTTLCYSQGTTPISAYTRNDSNHFEFLYGAISYGGGSVSLSAVYTADMINLSNYSKFVVDAVCTASGGEYWMLAGTYKGSASSIIINKPYAPTRTTTSYDISSITGEKYVGLYNGSSNAATCYNWYLEV